MALQDELQETFDLYLAAYRAGDSQGCAAVFLPDGGMISPWGAPATGRQAIAAQHGEWIGTGGGAGKQLNILAHGGAGGVAWTLASFSEGEATGDGVSLSVLERQSDGRWLIRLCSLNAGAAPIL